MSAKTIDSQKDAVQPSVAVSEAAPVRVLSQDDSQVAEFVKEQPTVEQIEQMTVIHHKIPNLLEFPDEVLAKHGKEYHFAWLPKGKDLSTKLRTNGWVLCTRTTCPWIKPTRFGSHGGLEQAGMLLAFMPKAMADQMYSQPALQSQAKVKHYTDGMFKNQDADAPVKFYKPVLKDED